MKAIDELHRSDEDKLLGYDVMTFGKGPISGRNMSLTS
jgi:hypothetical protein